MAGKVHALILAAGLSARMGHPKPLLPFGHRNVLQTVVDGVLLADLDGAVVVLGHRAGAIRPCLQGLAVEICENPRYRDGMLSSIRCGIAALPDDADAALIALGDQPQISSRIVQRVVAAYRETRQGLVIPTFEGRRGHPSIVDLGRYREEILALDDDLGLRPLMRGYPDDTLELPVDTPDILRDIDTPTDYEAELSRLRRSPRPKAP